MTPEHAEVLRTLDHESVRTQLSQIATDVTTRWKAGERGFIVDLPSVNFDLLPIARSTMATYFRMAEIPVEFDWDGHKLQVWPEESP